MITNTMRHNGQSYSSRMRIYLREMFPLPERIVNAGMLCASFAILLSMTAPGIQLEWRILTLGTFNAFALALILRLMDELKDLDIDRTLFADRAVPSGRVREEDIRLALTASIVVYLLVNLTARIGLSTALGLLAYALLMYKYFFLPDRWKAQLPVNLLTHNPIVALLLLHLVQLLSAGGTAAGGAAFSRSTALLVGMYWGLFLSWEIARKIRYREEETEYVTYSKILGRMWAVAAAGGAQTFSFAVGLWLAVQLDLSPVYPLLLSVAYILLVYHYVQFYRGRLTTGKVLKTAAERYAALVMTAALVERVVTGMVYYVF